MEGSQLKKWDLDARRAKRRGWGLACVPRDVPGRRSQMRYVPLFVLMETANTVTWSMCSRQVSLDVDG